MKQVLGVLLLSLGFYSFGFGFFISSRSLERQRIEGLRQTVYANEKPRPQLQANPIEQYPIGLFLLCAFGATTGFAGGLHLLLQEKTGKKKRSRK